VSYITGNIGKKEKKRVIYELKARKKKKIVKFPKI